MCAHSLRLWSADTSSKWIWTFQLFISFVAYFDQIKQYTIVLLSDTHFNHRLPIAYVQCISVDPRLTGTSITWWQHLYTHTEMLSPSFWSRMSEETGGFSGDHWSMYSVPFWSFVIPALWKLINPNALSYKWPIPILLNEQTTSFSDCNGDHQAPFP